MRTTLRAIAPTVAVVTALAAVTVLATRTHAFPPAGHAPVLRLVLLGWALFVLAVLALRRAPARHAARLVVVGAVLVGGAALAGPPSTSTDSARYAWDGIVQDHGISPYRYAPTDDAVADLRPTWLFPTPVVAADGDVSCPGERIEKTATTPSGAPLCTAINRPPVHTIYPPVSEAYFAAVRGVVPTTARYWPMQVAGLLVSLLVTGALLRGLRRRGLDVRWAALWAWCPFVASEAVTNSHVDVLGAALILAATLVAAPAAGSRVAGWAQGSRHGRRALLTGALVGLGAATKLVPALAAPPLLRRTPLRVALAAVATFALTYVPYVLASGSGVIGFLPGYLGQEGYDDGQRFALVGLLVPGGAATWVSAALVAALAVACWWRADPDAPWHAQVVLVGGAFLVMSPSYSWYALLLVPLVAMSGRWEWLAVPLALGIDQLYPLLSHTRPVLAGALGVVVVGTAWRWRAARRSAVAEPAHEPALNSEPAPVERMST